MVLLCGVPADFRLDYGSHLRRAKVISVNRSREDLYKNRRPDIPVLADAHAMLVALAASRDLPAREGWLAKLRERNDARDAEIRSLADEETEHINPLRLCMAIDERLKEDSILVGDGGDFVATASYVVSPGSPYCWLDPGVFGTLGVGAGFAIGAKLCRPDADVWLLYGDGAAGFSIMEFDTCARLGIPVIAVVGNDAGWTQIARDQTVILGDDVGTVLTHMDYHLVAEGCGAKGIRVDHADQVPEALDRALELSRAGHPVLVNALVGKTDFRKGSISI